MAGTRAALNRRSVQDIDEQIAALKAKRDEMQRRGRETMGRLCERAGLLDIDISTEELEAALKEVAARFRQHQVAPVGPETTPAPAGPGAA
jgi:TraC-like protein